MTPHRDIPHAALPGVVGTLVHQPRAPRRERASPRVLFGLFLAWLVALIVVTAVVVATVMSVRAIG